jgi:hypothetical protein
MAQTSPAAAVLDLLAGRLSITDMDTSSSDSNSSAIPSPSSAATSFELPSEKVQNQAAASLEVAAPSPPCQTSSLSSSSSSSTPPHLSFLGLPSDIHYLILTSYLPYDSIVALRSTSSYFHFLIPPSTLKRLRQNVVSMLLADERALLKKWLPEPYGRYNGRPTSHMTCYSCLQSLPITDFFAAQVTQSRALGRKRARSRWCKSCGQKYGTIGHGRWMDEISFGADEQLRYESVMGEELKIKNPCTTCQPKHRYDGQHVWWGCVGCFEKEERRIQKEDSERRRDIRRHCSNVKHGVQAFVEPNNLRERGREARWWLRSTLGWHALVRAGYSVYWWARDESLLTRTCRVCGRLGRVLDPRKMQEPGQKLGRKAKRAVGAVLEIAKKDKKHESSTAERFDASILALESCIICCDSTGDTRAVESDAHPAEQKALTTQPQHHDHNHVHIPAPRHEVRCWRCWRAKRSRRRRRYDDGMAYGLPLPRDRWCDGCQAEHRKFVTIRRERKEREDAAQENDKPKMEEVDIDLGALFGEV